MRHRLLALFAISVGLSLIGGCSLLDSGGGDEKTAEVVLRFLLPQRADALEPSVTYNTASGETGTVTADDMTDTREDTLARRFKSRKFAFSANGPLEVQCDLKSSGGKRVAQGSRSFQVRAGRNRTVLCYVGDQNPTKQCLEGCTDATAVPIDPQAALPPKDSLYLFAGG